jgi:hypothetical protein
MGVPIPPATNRGHFHIGNDEFWFILEGKIAYEMEDKGLIVSQAGDVVLALPGRFHRASFAPGQMDTRLAFNRSPTMPHNFAEDANGRQQARVRLRRFRLSARPLQNDGNPRAVEFFSETELKTTVSCRRKRAQRPAAVRAEAFRNPCRYACW